MKLSVAPVVKLGFNYAALNLDTRVGDFHELVPNGSDFAESRSVNS